MSVLFITVFMLGVTAMYSQDLSAVKFGKISEADFKNKVYQIDTGASAVVLADIGHTQIKGNDKGSVSLEFRYHRRIHVLRNSGYDIATVEIPLYKDGDDEEQLKDLKAVTYNLEGSKIAETKLNVKNSVFSERIDRNRVIKKFTFPNLKEGSIIEYEYKLVSDFLFNLQPWNFQSKVPQLWTQYTVSMPQFLDYVMIEQGNLPFLIRNQTSRQGNYMIAITKEVYGGKTETERLDITCTVTDFVWAMKDVPAFDNEPYITTPRNYIAKLEFQLAGYLPPFMEQKIMTTWPDMTKRLLSKGNFGGQLTGNDYWMAPTLDPLLKGSMTQTQKAQKIYSYIRDNYACTGYSQLFADVPLGKIVDKKRGGVAELNLLLVSMLRGAGLQADPVILSTRPHGIVSEEYPVFHQFNYVICQVNADGKNIFLDASRPMLGFGKLHYDCYNGPARVVNEAATLVNLKSEDLTETSQTSVLMQKESGGKWTGNINKVYGTYGSEIMRQKIKTADITGLQKELESKLGGDVKIENIKADSVSVIDEPVTLRLAFRTEKEAADIIYLNPVLAGNYQENPFKSSERKWPVEMPYNQHDIYTVNIEVPDGYKVDEMPKAVSLKINTGGDAVFDYRISETGGVITMNYKVEFKRTGFSANEYNLLREFFNGIVSKLNEPVVFKKK